MHLPSTTVRRTADLRLRGRVHARVRWPAVLPLGSPPPVVVVLADPSGTRVAAMADDALCDALCGGLGALVIHVSWGDGALERAAGALDWVADHAGELDGDPRRVLVAGRDRAAAAASALAMRATDDDWPRLAGQVLVVWRPCADDRRPTRVRAAPPAATIVTPVGGCRLAQRLRAAGARVDELVDPRVDPNEHPAQPFLPSLIDALRRSVDERIATEGERRGTG